MADSGDKRIEDLSVSDQEILRADLVVERQEPPQVIIVREESAPETSTVMPAKIWVTETAEKFQDFIAAAEEMKKVLGRKIQNRRVTVPSSNNPMVRNAIRRLFGVDSETVTYEMFQEALRIRSEIVEENS